MRVVWKVCLIFKKNYFGFRQLHKIEQNVRHGVDNFKSIWICFTAQIYQYT